MTPENTPPHQDNPQAKQQQAVERLLNAYNQENLAAWDLSYSELLQEPDLHSKPANSDKPKASKKKSKAKTPKVQRCDETPFQALFRKYDPYLFLECCYTLNDAIGPAASVANHLSLQSFENGDFVASVSKLSIPSLKSEDLQEKVKRKPYTCAISADGRTAAVHEEDRIQLWNLETETLISDIPKSLLKKHLEGHKGMATTYLDLLLSPDGKILMVSGQRFTMFWAIAEACELKAVFPSIRLSYKTLAFSPDSQTLVILAGYDLRVLDMKTMTFKAKEHRASYGSLKITALAFSPDGQAIASGGWVSPRYREGARFAFREAQTLERKAFITGISRSLDHSAVMALAFSPNGKTLALMNRGRIFFRDALTEQTPLDKDKCVVFEDDYMQGRRSVLEAHVDEVQPGDSSRYIPSSLAFSADGHFLVSCYHNVIKVWRVKPPSKFLMPPDRLFQGYLNLFTDTLSPDLRTAFLEQSITFPHWQAWEAAYLAKQDQGETNGSVLRDVVKAGGKFPLYWLAYLLKTKQWQLADQETEAVILKYAGVPQQPHVSQSDIAAIPLQLLRVIDRLWTTHSDRLYGFTAQANVWGSTVRREGKLHKQDGREVAVKTDFQMRLGWKGTDFHPNYHGDGDEYQTNAYNETSEGYYPRKINSKTLLAIQIIRRLGLEIVSSGD